MNISVSNSRQYMGLQTLFSLGPRMTSCLPNSRPRKALSHRRSRRARCSHERQTLLKAPPRHQHYNKLFKFFQARFTHYFSLWGGVAL